MKNAWMGVGRPFYMKNAVFREGLENNFKRYLKSKLSDIENKQVIIVSHNQEFTKLDQIINVIKENDVSRIQTQSYGD